MSGKGARHTRDPKVLEKISELIAAFPVARRHRQTLNAAQSDFTYASPAPTPGPFSGLWLALVRLSPELEDRYAIHQEIPVVYSPHSDLQGRTIVMLKEVFCLLPQERRGFAGGVAFLWASDPKLDTKLEKFSKTELVLMSIPEDGPDALVQTLASHLYSQDLYRERTYVTGSQFFGRRALLAELRGDLADHRVSAVFGTRKTGKTSILMELVRTASAANHTDLIEIFVYEDLEHLPRPSSGRDPIPELLDDLARDIQKELRIRSLRANELANLPDEPSLREFRMALTETLRHPANIQLSLVIILDEIEHLCPPDADKIDPAAGNESIPQFFGVLRKLTQELDNFTFSVAGLASAVIESGELYGRHNPLFNLANTYYLSPFTRGEAQELLQGIGSRIGISWQADAIDSAHAETGGQVVLLRELAAQVWEARRKETIDKVEISLDDVELVIPAYRRAVRSQINETINHVQKYYPDEFELCDELMSSPVGFHEVAEVYPAQINRLINLGLIIEHEGRWTPTQVLHLGWSKAKKPASVGRLPTGSIKGLIALGESRTLEFKSSIRTPLAQEVAEVVVVESLVKAILGFLNADGGRVLAGVSDDGTVIGLNPDIKRSRGSKDKLVRFVVDKLNSYLGQTVCSDISIEWEEVNGSDILIFEVRRSEGPVFPIRNVDGRADLFVRQNANVVPFSSAEQYSYVKRHFTD